MLVKVPVWPPALSINKTNHFRGAIISQFISPSRNAPRAPPHSSLPWQTGCAGTARFQVCTSVQVRAAVGLLGGRTVQGPGTLHTQYDCTSLVWCMGLRTYMESDGREAKADTRWHRAAGTFCYFIFIIIFFRKSTILVPSFILTFYSGKPTTISPWCSLVVKAADF